MWHHYLYWANIAGCMFTYAIHWSACHTFKPSLTLQMMTGCQWYTHVLIAGLCHVKLATCLLLIIVLICSYTVCQILVIIGAYLPPSNCLNQCYPSFVMSHLASQLSMRYCSYMFIYPISWSIWHTLKSWVTHHIITGCHWSIKMYPSTHWGQDKKCCHFAGNIFKCISLNENFWILNKISLNYVP